MTETRVNSVAPGNVATTMHFDALREEAIKRGIGFEEIKKTEWDKIHFAGCAGDPADLLQPLRSFAGRDGA